MAWDSTKSAPRARQPEPSTPCPVRGGYRRSDSTPLNRIAPAGPDPVPASGPCSPSYPPFRRRLRSRRRLTCRSGARRPGASARSTASAPQAPQPGQTPLCSDGKPRPPRTRSGPQAHSQQLLRCGQRIECGQDPPDLLAFKIEYVHALDLHPTTRRRIPQRCQRSNVRPADTPPDRATCPVGCYADRRLDLIREVGKGLDDCVSERPDRGSSASRRVRHGRVIPLDVVSEAADERIEITSIPRCKEPPYNILCPGAAQRSTPSPSSRSPHVRRTPRISCEAAPAPMLAARAQGGTWSCRSRAALSFVYCIRLFDGVPRSTSEASRSCRAMSPRAEAIP